jgi:subtilisin-like proprotein convertase family protein
MKNYNATKANALKTICAITLLLLLSAAIGQAQVTVTITCTGTTGSFNSGSVNSSGTINDGNLVNLSSSSNRGWARFDLSSIPTGATVTAVTSNFTTFSSTSSFVSNNIYGFTGNPSSMGGAALYSACASGSSFNNTSWTANAANSKAFNAAGITFIQTNIGGFVNIGFVRGSTNTYNIYGYPGTSAQKPTLEITYTPPCSGTPTAGTATATPASACVNNAVSLQLTGFTSGVSGITFQWKKSSVSGGPYSNISGATTSTYSYTPTASGTEYIICQVTCTHSGLNANSNEVPLVVNPLPSFTLGNSGPVCLGSSLTLTCSLAGASYAWSGPAGFSSVVQNPVISSFGAANAGTYTCTVTQLGCSSSGTTVANFKLVPGTAAASNVTSVCPGGAVNLSGNGFIQSTNSTAIAIPDNNTAGINSTITIPSGITLSSHTDLEVDITFSPAHTFAGDVIVRLTSPASGNTLLFDRPGVPASTFGNSDNLAGPYTFRTTATSVIPETTGSSGGVIPSGSYRPSNTSGAAHNWSGLTFPVSASGTWTLNVSDRASGDVGTLSSWTIRIKNPGGITYSWTSTPSGFASSNANPTANPTVATTYHVTGTLDGCTGAASSVTVSINPVPTPTASTNAPVCVGDLLTVSALPNGMTSYVWSGPSGFSSTAQNPTVTSSATLARAGNYTVTVTNSFGCSATATTNVVVHDRPVPFLISSTDVTCHGGSDGQAVVGSSGAAPFLFDWGFNNDYGTTATITGLSAGTIMVNVTDDNGCTSNPDLSVTTGQPSQVVAAPSGNNPACIGLSLNLLANASGGTPGYTYVWTGPNGFSSTDANPVRSGITALDAGSYQVSVTDNNGCNTVSAVTIGTTSQPTATISGSIDLCLGNSGIVSLNFTGTGPWNYSVVGSGGPYNGSTSNSSINLSVTPATGGHQVYNVVTVSDANCSGTVSGSANAFVSTTAPTSSVHTIGAPVARCSGDVELITVNTVSGQFVKYSWNTGSNSSQVLFSNDVGGPFAAGPFTTSATQVYAQFSTLAANSSGYNICVKGINGCGVTNNKCTFVRGKVTTPSAITGTSVQCANATGQVYSVANLPAGTETFLWNFSVPGAVITPLDPPLNSQVSIDFPSFSTGTLSVSAALSCLGTSVSAPRSLQLNNATANPAVPSGPNKVCPGQTYAYSVPAVNGAASYLWNVPANATIVGPATGNSINVQYNSTPISFVGGVSVSVQSICGVMSGTMNRSISSMVPTTPGNISGGNTGTCDGPRVFSVPAVSGVIYNWSWPAGVTNNTPNGFNSISLQFPNNFVSGTISVTGEASGCSVTSAARTLNISGVPAQPASITPIIAPCAFSLGQFQCPAVPFATSYQWNVPNNGTVIDAGQGTNTLDVTWGAGNGTISVKAANACGVSGTRTYFYVPGCRLASTNSVQSKATELFPNPATENTTLRFYSEKDATHFIALTDLQGRNIRTLVFDAAEGVNSITINTSDLSTGIYLVELRSDGHHEIIRLTVE